MVHFPRVLKEILAHDNLSVKICRWNVTEKRFNNTLQKTSYIHQMGKNKLDYKWTHYASNQSTFRMIYSVCTWLEKLIYQYQFYLNELWAVLWTLTKLSQGVVPIFLVHNNNIRQSTLWRLFVQRGRKYQTDITKLAIFIGGKITNFISLHFNDGCKEFIRGELVERGTGKSLKRSKGRERLSVGLINCLEI